MQWKLSLPKLPMLVYYFVKLTGLAPFNIKDNTFCTPTLLGKIYPVFVAAGYSLFALIAFIPGIEAFYAQNYSPFLRIWGALQYLMGIPSILGTLIIFSLMHKEIVYLMNKLCTINNEFKCLGIEEMDHGKILKNIFASIAIANAVLVTKLIVIISLQPHRNIIDAIKFCVDSWFALNMILTFAQISIFIRKSFTLVNERLYDLATPASLIRFSHYTQILVASRNSNRGGNQPSSEGLCTDFQRIRIIGTLHMELSDLLNRTTHVFAPPILLISFRFLIDFVLHFYWIYSASLKSSHFRIRYISCSILEMSFLTAQLFIMAHASYTVCKQGNATKTVLFKVWNKFKPEKPTDDGVHRLFLKFSYQLMHTTLAVSAFGFMDLGYSFICKIFGIVITYLIIVIQFDTSRGSP